MKNIHILPKEEPKQETLEDAAEKEFPLIDTKWCRTGDAEEENFELLRHRRSFIKGANWQAERMYSEEDMINFTEWVIINYQNQYKLLTTPDKKGFYTTKELLIKWLENLKKN